MVSEKKRLHIATLGLYRNDLVDYVIRKCKVDKIAIIYTEKNEEDLEKIKADNEALGIPVASKKVLPWNHFNILAGILEIVSAHEDYDIDYNITCGTRVMTSAAYLAALSTDSKVYFVMDPYSKVPAEIIKVYPLSIVTLTDPKRRILEKLNDLGGEVDSMTDLGTRVELGVGSVSRHVNSLDAAGYVRKIREGKTTRLELTDLGLIILNLKKSRKKAFWGK